MLIIYRKRMKMLRKMPISIELNLLIGDAEDLIPQMIQQSTHEEIIAVIGEFLSEQ